MGTIPTNALSQLQFRTTGSNETAFVSFWPLHCDRTYQLLARPELGVPVWQNVATNPAASPEGQGTFTLSTTNSPQLFYRLKVLMATNGAAAALSAARREPIFAALPGTILRPVPRLRAVNRRHRRQRPLVSLSPPG